MNKHLIAMIAMLCGPLLGMEMKEEVDATSVSGHNVTTTFDENFQEFNNLTQQMITQLPKHLQEDFEGYLAYAYVGDESGAVANPNIELRFFQNIDSYCLFKGLAHAVDRRLHWIIPIDETEKNSSDLNISMSGLRTVNDEKSEYMLILDRINSGLLAQWPERATKLLKGIASEQQEQLDILAPKLLPKLELCRFTSNPNNFCGLPTETKVTLRALEVAIKKGKFKYSKNENAARKALALQLLGVKLEKDAEAAYTALVAVYPEPSKQKGRAFYKKTRKFRDHEKYRDAIHYLRQIN